MSTRGQTGARAFRGFIRPSVLWHVRAAGACTEHRLQALIGCHMSSLQVSLRPMLDEGLLRQSHPVKATVYSLTERGTAEAAKVEIKEVEFA